jgi:LacI family transcriptional regulator
VEIGQAAAQHLIARLEGRPVNLFQTLPFELVIRGSTAAPRESVGIAALDRANRAPTR